MKRKSRIAALLTVAAFLITALMPAAGMAADDGPTITAKVGSQTVNQSTASSGFTQVAVGTAVTLTASPGISGGSDPSDNPADPDPQPGTGGRETRYAWTADTQTGNGFSSDEANGASITVTPTAAGTFKYTVTDAGDSGSSAKATFSLRVVNELTLTSPVSAQAGQTVPLEPTWGNGSNTVVPTGMSYAWTAQSADIPQPTPTNALNTKIEIPGNTPNKTSFQYSVTPSLSSLPSDAFKTTNVTVNVANAFAADPGASTITWYRGDEKAPTLTASFTGGTLASAAWYKDSETGDPVSQGAASGTTSTYTPAAAETTNWAAGAHVYYCKATSTTGAEAAAKVTVNVTAPNNPAVTGSAAVAGNTYAEGAGTCKLDAVAAGPPVLTVTASGGTGGALAAGSSAGSADGTTGGTSSGTGTAASSYTYQWYTRTSGKDEPISGAAANTLSLTQTNLAAAGDTAIFVCVVGISGNTAATASQIFEVTTVEQAGFEEDTAASSDEELTYPVGTELETPVTLAVEWNPPVPPRGVNGYQWSLISAPSNGQATVKMTSGSNPYNQGGQWQTGAREQSVQITQFSAAGTYVITCVPLDSASRATYKPIEFQLIAGQPSLPEDLTTYYAIQANDGDITTDPSAPVTNGTVSVSVNSRAALYIPNASTGGGSKDIVTEWIMRRTPGDPEEPLPSNAGFYGVNDETLVTGPVTAQMNGWEFCMKVSSANAPSLSTTSPWIRLQVNGSAPSTTPRVVLSSTPAAVGSNVTVSAGGNVTFTANVTNTSSIPASNLSYQWYSQAASQGAIAQTIEGATSATYTVSDVTDTMNGLTYWCVVANRGHMNEQGTSNRLTLTVNNQSGAVVISEPTGPSLTNLAQGSSVTVSVAASTTDGSSVNYQWYTRRSAGQIPVGTAVTSVEEARQLIGSATLTTVPEGTSPTLTIPSLDPGVYEYTCRVTSSAQSSLSQYSAPYYIAVTNVSTKPVIIAPTSPITYVGGKAGDALYLTCEAYLPTDASPTYQWQASTSSMGPWSDLGSYTDADLRIPSLSDQNNGAYYRCVVTNPGTGEQTDSNPYQVSVWDPSDTPTVVSNPQSITYTVDTSGSLPADNTGYLESSATSGNTAGLRAKWQYRPIGGTWVDVPNSAFGDKITGPATNNGVSRLTLAANVSLQAPSGEYRCIWMTGTQTPNSPLVPQSSSLPAVVEIVLPGNPRIVAQPTGASVHVGSAASFTVSADLGQTGTLVYVWQTSSDRGKTWRNCTSAADGTGQFTSTFHTYPVTQEMYETLAAASPGNLGDSIYQYRCIVANRDKSVDVISQPAPLVILPGASSTPTIAPGSGSSIKVTGSGGARYAEGMTVSRTGTSVSSFLRDLRFTAPAGYTMQLLSQSGQSVDPDSVVCTGMKLVLVQTVTEETVDTVHVVIMGDVLGQGTMNLSQLVRIAAAFRGRAELSGAFYQAALLTGKSTIQLSDIVAEAALYKTAMSGSSGDTPASPAPSASSSPDAQSTASASASPSASASASPSASGSN